METIDKEKLIKESSYVIGELNRRGAIFFTDVPEAYVNIENVIKDKNVHETLYNKNIVYGFLDKEGLMQCFVPRDGVLDKNGFFHNILVPVEWKGKVRLACRVFYSLLGDCEEEMIKDYCK